MPCMDLKRLIYTFGYEKVKIESEKVKQKEGGREGENRTRWENRSYYKYAMVDGKRENLSGGGLLIQLIVLSCFLLLYFMELSNYFSNLFPSHSLEVKHWQSMLYLAGTWNTSVKCNECLIQGLRKIHEEKRKIGVH